MTALAITLFALGCADLARSSDRSRGRLWALSAAVAAAVVGSLLLGAFTASELTLVTLGLLSLVGWVVTSSRRMVSRFDYGLPLGVLGLGLLIQLGALAWAGDRTGADGLLHEWVDRVPLAGGAVPAATALLVASAMLVQLSTANIVVRLVLASVGALKPVGQPQASDQLRGGRLLGPMERLLILGLGLAGQPTAAALVIAAKGLLRFPELQAQARVGRGTSTEPGIDELTEYFLIGSFVSWLCALATLAFIAVFA